MDIIYTLPNISDATRSDFQDLAKLLKSPSGTESTECVIDSPCDATDEQSNLRTIFRLDADITQARLILRRDGFRTDEAKGFLHDTRAGSAFLSFATAAKRLQGHVQRIDHTGVCVRSDLPAAAWLDFADALSHTDRLYEYPAHEDGYDPEKNLWYFVVPQSSMPTTKFELVHDADIAHSVIQIDLKTTLSRKEAEEMFPAPEGFALEGLENYFRSVHTHASWPGAHTIRLDLRFKSDHADSVAWESGSLLTSKGTNVSLARLPAFTQPRV